MDQDLLIISREGAWLTTTRAIDSAGRTFFVNEVEGDDTLNGMTPETALRTYAEALRRCAGEGWAPLAERIGGMFEVVMER